MREAGAKGDGLRAPGRGRGGGEGAGYKGVGSEGSGIKGGGVLGRAKPMRSTAMRSTAMRSTVAHALSARVGFEGTDRAHWQALYSHALFSAHPMRSTALAWCRAGPSTVHPPPVLRCYTRRAPWSALGEGLYSALVGEGILRCPTPCASVGQNHSGLACVSAVECSCRV